MDVVKSAGVDTFAQAVEDAGMLRDDFHIRICDEGWIVRCGEVSRRYPLNEKADQLIADDIRRGAFGPSHAESLLPRRDLPWR